MMNEEKPADPPIYCIAILSAASLSYEILLIRLFSIVQWHHFAYMIISLALLGYGASGTFLALILERLRGNIRRYFLMSILGFSVSSLVCFLIAQRISFHPEEMLWNWRQAVRLPLIYLILSVPFFFVASAIGMMFSRHRDNATRIYAADLLGAGAGSIGVIALLNLVSPSLALKIISVAGLGSALMAHFELKLKSRTVPVLIATAWAGLFLMPASWVQLSISQYKGLPQTLSISGTRVLQEKSSALAFLTVVESSKIPLRSAPGLSINSKSEPPSQLAVFQDADAMTVITRYNGDLRNLAYLDDLTSAVPYHLKPVRDLLVLGSGGGSDLLQARYHRVTNVDAVELNAQLVTLLQKDYAAFSGNLYNDSNTRIYVDEARGFVRRQSRKYDLIQLAVPGGFGASSAGLYAVNENYLFTVEAFQDYFRRLNPDGFLAVTTWVQVPPRSALKLFSTALLAMKRSSMTRPEDRLLFIRSWQTSTIVIKNGFLTMTEIAKMREFCAGRSFDLAYYPGMKADEANRYNLLPQPTLFFDAARALLSNASESFLQSYKFNIRPATDNSPYFYHFFKWQILPEVVHRYGQGGVLLLESGYLVLIASLIQAMVLSFVFILLPLWTVRLIRRKGQSNTGSSGIAWSVLFYFFALGLAFLFIEIAFIQKFMLFLYHPISAVSVTIGAFLVFAGLGSAYSKKMEIRFGGLKTVRIAVLAITVLGILHIGSLATFFNLFSSAVYGLRVILTIVLIAPLAFFMGMLFPQGLFALKGRSEFRIPWAWGVNGCASVLSAILAAILAIHFGFNVLVFLALMLYGSAVMTFPRLSGK